jgi:hypothetical protein
LWIDWVVATSGELGAYANEKTASLFLRNAQLAAGEQRGVSIQGSKINLRCKKARDDD